MVETGETADYPPDGELEGQADCLPGQTGNTPRLQSTFQASSGSRLGAYRLVRRLGRGGMGEVWLARHDRLGCDRALKLLFRELVADRRWRARMVREARIAAGLNHPNIATLHELIEEDSCCALVMEYVPGETLARRISRGRLSVDKTIGLARQVVEALDAAHSREREVVHRDLKPENIAVREDGVVKVLDWGIARTVRRAPHTGGIRRPVGSSLIPAISGTPGYMSPEQAWGKPADKRADIWAFGCILYECLTGCRPYPIESYEAFLEALASQEPDWALLDGVASGCLASLVRHCLQKDPTRRMRDIGDALPILLESPLAEVPQRLANNLPPSLTSFIGRLNALSELRRFLHSSPLVTLVGPGGTGKTALAMKLARDLLRSPTAEEREWLRDGLWFVDLAPVTDSSQIMHRIASAVPGVLVDQADADVLLSRMAPLRTLILLDNCEHLHHACAKVVHEILHRCQDVRVVATSREALRINGEQVFQVPPLSLPRGPEPIKRKDVSEYEATSLFVERAKAIRRNFTVDDRSAAMIANICHLLDGVPLAVELAAARIRALSIQQINDRLGDLLDARSSGNRRDMPARHETLDATIRWSYDLLAPSEKLLFERLSVFRGGWTLEAAESICTMKNNGNEAVSIAQPDVLEILEGLVGKSLVLFEEVRGWPRYRLLSAVQQFAARALENRGGRAVVSELSARHARFYCRFASEVQPRLMGREQAVWLEAVENDLENFRAAVEWALSSPDEAELAMELATSLQWLCYVRGYAREGLEWVEAALSLRRGAADLLQSRAFNAAGLLAAELDRFEQARKFYQQGLSIAQHLGDDWRIAAIHSNIGLAAHQQGDVMSAQQAYEDALRIYERLGDSAGLARVRLNAAIVALNLGDIDRAETLIAKVLPTLTSLHDEIRIGEVWQIQGEIHRLRGDVAAAEHAFRESLEIRRRLGEKHAILRCLAWLGVVAAERTRLEEAVLLIEHSQCAADREGLIFPVRLRTSLLSTSQRLQKLLGEARYEELIDRAKKMERHDVDALLDEVGVAVASETASVQRAATR